MYWRNITNIVSLTFIKIGNMPFTEEIKGDITLHFHEFIAK